MKKKKMHISLISHYPSRKEWESASWEIIVRSPDILNALTTPRERHDLVMRTAVIERIHSGKSYREIGKELWCSPQTISSIKKALYEKKYRSYRERGKTERKKRVYSSFSRRAEREPKKRKAYRDYGMPQLSGISRRHPLN